MKAYPKYDASRWRAKPGPPPMFKTITPSPGPIGLNGPVGVAGVAGMVKDYKAEKEEALKLQMEKNKMMGIAYKVSLFKQLQPAVITPAAQPEVEEGLYDSESCEVDNEF